MSIKSLQPIRGFQDIYPGTDFLSLIDILYTIGKRLNLTVAFTPLLEDSETFIRAIGEGTDIVEKEMFSFQYEDKTLVLRPEMTASVVRMCMNIGSFNERIMYCGPNFRKERPQKGRRRQFNQFGVELIGNNSISADIDCLEFIRILIQELKLDCTLLINTIGSSTERKKYSEVIKNLINPEELSEISLQRFKNEKIFRILDSKLEQDKKVVAKLPKLMDFLSPQSLENFKTIQKYLKSVSMKFEIDPTLVRGLDYYNDLVFELISPKLDNKSILGGGRYDGLFTTMGSKTPVSAVGFAIGIERLLEVSNFTTEIIKKKFLLGFLIEDYRIYNYLPYINTKAWFESKTGNLTEILRYANANKFDFLVIIDNNIQKDKIIIKDLTTSKETIVELTNLTNFF